MKNVFRKFVWSDRVIYFFKFIFKFRMKFFRKSLQFFEREDIENLNAFLPSTIEVQFKPLIYKKTTSAILYTNVRRCHSNIFSPKNSPIRDEIV